MCVWEVGGWGNPVDRWRTACVWAIDLISMESCISTTEPGDGRVITEGRRLSPGLSVFVLLALLSAAPGAFAVECAPNSVRTTMGPCVVPVIVVSREVEEPALWRPEAVVRERIARDGVVRVVPLTVREALLNLPPPASV